MQGERGPHYRTMCDVPGSWYRPGAQAGPGEGCHRGSLGQDHSSTSGKDGAPTVSDSTGGMGPAKRRAGRPLQR